MLTPAGFLRQDDTFFHGGEFYRALRFNKTRIIVENKTSGEISTITQAELTGGIVTIITNVAQVVRYE